MYAVLVKRKGSATEILYSKCRTKAEAIKLQSRAGKDNPARIIHVTVRTYPREVAPK